MSDYVRRIFIGFLLFSLFSCATSNQDRGVQTFGYKTIFIGHTASVETLGYVISNWVDISEAIYSYTGSQCLQKTLKVDHLVSVDFYTDERRNKYVEGDSFSDVYSVGTINPCVSYPSSSAWIVLYKNNQYQVVGEVIME